MDALPEAWSQVRAPVIVPLLRLAVAVCLTMSVLLFLERVYMAVVISGVRLLRLRPDRRYRCDPLPEDDPELGSSAFPVVLVQIPMFNEREVRTPPPAAALHCSAMPPLPAKRPLQRFYSGFVGSLITLVALRWCHGRAGVRSLQVYQLSIGAVCGLSWPADRLVVQVLDDSTDEVIKEMVRMECERWARKGINITYQIREDRKGYKAGALRAGMRHAYVRDCEYVAIFDADFQPDPDYLKRTIPYLVHNPEIALVQARWRFVNADECLMTRMQEMSLDYHFTVEQEVSSSVCAFFGFNGTAGVWRISAVNEAGGWKDRTTVEDMDLAIRASLKGWKFVYLGDVQVKSELPSTFKAFRFQQHRWSCGPANLFRKMLMEIVTNKKVTIWKKIHVIYNFFLIRKIIAHIITFSFYCVIIPATIFVPEVRIPKWGCVYIPSAITLLNSVGTPR
ncbi:Glucomannan 4-beta-mannosyltransferase 2 [Zea mays]|nr:Glucomannan 4-beta-mannosyltransferase 2 [Zea mays]